MPKKRAGDSLTQEKKVLKSIKKEIKQVHNDEKEIKKLERRLLKQEKKIFAEEKRIEATEKRILKEEKDILLAIGKLKIKKEHVLDLVKIIAGALVGTGIGSVVISNKSLAETLPWINISLIIGIALFLAGLLVYKAERKRVVQKKHPVVYILSRVVYIWVVATVISGAVSFLFITESISASVTVKSLLIGSFPAIAGAVGFDFI